MGKRSKVANNNEELEVKKKLTVIESKLKKSIKSNEVLLKLDKNKKKHRKKVKKLKESSKVESCTEVKADEEAPGTVEKIENTASKNVKIAKKTVFIDDQPHEVTVGSSAPNTSKSNKKFLNEDEADVKEEDIDRFIDELDEEDNKQYEDWIKLIEARLHPNKKTI